ncbi:MAG: P-loop NTPase fold protein [Ginsengibacter sp.]
MKTEITARFIVGNKCNKRRGEAKCRIFASFCDKRVGQKLLYAIKLNFIIKSLQVRLGSFSNFFRLFLLKVFNKENNKSYIYTLVGVAIFVLFKKKIDEGLLTVVVRPLLSYVYPSKWLYDIIILSGFIGVLFYFIKKIKKNALLPTNWFLISLCFLSIYLLYRTKNDPFIFTSFRLSKYIMLFDAIIILPVIISSISIFRKVKSDGQLKRNLGFDPDDPWVLSEKNDLLNRLPYVKELSGILRNTELNNRAFSVGVVAPWGNGKTTFLHSIRNELANDFIMIDLDVWKCNSTEVIIQTFFQLLKNALKPFSFSINNQIKNYTYSLLKDSRNNIAKNFSEYFFSNKNIEEQYDEINTEIIKIDKKILVFIDDIDRLNKKEIYEIIRLIRNTANFYNTFFIVAYDRSYLLNAIEEINSYHPNLFLEKIFQLEFVLPAIDKKILYGLLISEINELLTEESKKKYEDFHKIEIAFGYNRTDLTSSFIHNIRDVKRFKNSFKIDYQFVRDEVFFEDFYNLQLIKFKHPEIFMEFYNNKGSLVINESKGNFYPQTLTYKLSKESSDSPDKSKQEFKLKNFLKARQKLYKIDESEIDVIVKSFGNIFSDPKFKINYETKTFFSVIIPSMFDRYFRLNILGNLSDIEFGNARNSSIETFLTKIDEWNNDKNLISQVVDRLEGIDVYDNKDDFEKIIKAMFHLGRVAGAYLYKNLYEKLNNYGDMVTSKYYNYDNGKKDYVKFTYDLFASANSPYLFESQLVKYFKSVYYDENSFVLPLKKLNEFNIEYFRKYCLEEHKISHDFWILFWNTEVRIIKNDDNDMFTKDKALSEEVKSLFKDFISNKDLDGFLLGAIHPALFGSKQFILSTSIATIFTDWPSFEHFLNKQDETKWSYLKEFKEFFYIMKGANFERNVDFIFKDIPVSAE